MCERHKKQNCFTCASKGYPTTAAPEAVSLDQFFTLGD